MTTANGVSGAGFTPGTAVPSTLREHLDAIAQQQNGKLTPVAVVNVASDPAHALHSRFEWDDTIAGPKYREHQAAELIRSVKVVWQASTGDINEGDNYGVRQWVSIKESTGHAYLNIESVVQDPLSMKILLRQAEFEVLALIRRNRGIQGFYEMVIKHVNDAAA